MRMKTLLALAGALALVAPASVLGLRETTNKTPMNVGALEETTKTIIFDLGELANDIEWKSRDIYLRAWNGKENSLTPTQKLTGFENVFTITVADSVINSISGGFTFRAANDGGSDDSKELAWIPYADFYKEGNSFNGVIGCSAVVNESTNQRRQTVWTTFYEMSGTKYSEAVPVSFESKRIWCRAEMSWWYAGNTRTGLRTWEDGTTPNPTVYLPKVIKNSADGLFLWYFDIPVAAKNIQFVRVAPHFNAVVNYSPEVPSTAKTADVHYIYEDAEKKTIALGQGSPAKVTAEVVAEVIAGYTTCTASEVNGYKAVPSLHTNFVSKLDAKGLEALKTTMISDYKSHTTGGVYGEDDIKEKDNTSIYSKWNQMVSLNGGTDAPTGLIKNVLSADNMVGTVITISSLLVIVAIGAIVLAYKKKEIRG